jgi:hypothetical protein
MLEHMLEVKRDALAEGGPSLGGSFGMSDPMNIFPRNASYLGLDDLLSWLPGFVGEEMSIKLICSFHGDGELRSLNGPYGLFLICLGDS